MSNLGAAHLLVALLLVGLVYDSRRFRALARLTGRKRQVPGPALPDGNLERVGLPLRLVQMRINVDWEDGGAGWDGPEVLADEEGDAEIADEAGLSLFPEGEGRTEPETAVQPEPKALLPVLWQPFPALLTPQGTDERPPEPCLVLPGPAAG